jgi:hypothetical protein
MKYLVNAPVFYILTDVYDPLVNAQTSEGQGVIPSHSKTDCSLSYELETYLSAEMPA